MNEDLDVDSFAVDEESSSKNRCSLHTHIKQVPCTKCIEYRSKYCISFIDSTCSIEVYDEGYEFCERGW